MISANINQKFLVTTAHPSMTQVIRWSLP